MMKASWPRLLIIFALLAGCAPAAMASDASGLSAAPLWTGGAETRPDTHIAFRGGFEMREEGEVEFRVLGAGWFNAWLNGEFFAEGPARFHRSAPEYETITADLPAGRHVLAAQVHYPGVQTRILDDIEPFWLCEVRAGGETVPIDWGWRKLEGYEPEVRRVNPQLGWIEWRDTRRDPPGWRERDFDDSAWNDAIPASPDIGTPKPLSIGGVERFTHDLTPIAEGPLADVFGYERDDIPARFFLRDLGGQWPAQGVWRRYDLGRVRLFRPRFVLDLPEGAAVEFAYSETLSRGRVAPYINLSAGPSCNLDHYTARGGVQEFFPLTPRGGRYVEVHILADPGKIAFLRESFIERCYYGPPEGSFECGDELLNRVWKTGIETLRGCAEDALTDNPTRERGQWTGDVATIGMEIGSAGYSDMRLFRRALVQSALCARDDGLTAGLCPGGEGYLPSYAAQWTGGCLRYWELTGDLTLLRELYPHAKRNMDAFAPCITEDGVADGLGWTFIDWGYVRNEGPADMAYTLHVLEAVRGMIRWCSALERPDEAEAHRSHERALAAAARRWFRERLESEGWMAIGYHRAVLGLRLGFFAGGEEKACVQFIKQHILDCFPNDSTAPRNRDPAANHPRLITPYFAHYALPPLIERGEMDFALNQYRTCWGWALEEGRTTWVEVFDTRWSHCHQWAGCPTAQLTRYALGLHTRYDKGPRRFQLNLRPGPLEWAKGTLPLPGGNGEAVRIEWARDAGGIRYRLHSPRPVAVELTRNGKVETAEFQGQATFRLDAEGAPVH